MFLLLLTLKCPGLQIALVGLILQLISFLSFTLILLYFGYKVRTTHPLAWAGARSNSPPPSSSSSSTTAATSQASLWKFWKKEKIEDWRVLYWAVCWTTLGFLTRSAFRIVEFSQGLVFFFSLFLFLSLQVRPTSCSASRVEKKKKLSSTSSSGRRSLIICPSPHNS